MGVSGNPFGVIRRALDFDENTYEYIIADLDPLQAAAADQQEAASGQATPKEEAVSAAAPEPAPPAPKGRGGRKRVPVEGARAVAVARTAGG